MTDNVKVVFFVCFLTAGAWMDFELGAVYIYYKREVNDIQKHRSTYAKTGHMWPDGHLTCPHIDANVHCINQELQCCDRIVRFY